MAARIKLPTRAQLHAAPRMVGRARVSYDRDKRTYSVWAPGSSIRETKRYPKAMDLAVGLA